MKPISWNVVSRAVARVLVVFGLAAAAILIVSCGGLSDAQQRYNEGVKAMEEGRLQDAIDSYSQAIELDENFASAYVNRSNAYNQVCEYDKARSDADVAIELDEGAPLGYVNRLLALDGMGKYDEALSDADKLIDIYGEDDTSGYFLRAVVHTDNGSFDEAIDDLETVISGSDDASVLAGAHILKSVGHQNLGRETEALDEADAAVEFNDADTDARTRALLNRSRVLAISGRNDQALEDANAAIALRPDDVDLLAQAYLQRGTVLTELGRFEDALADEEAAIGLGPTEACGTLAKAHFHRALSLDDLGRGNDAVTAADEACDLGLEDACDFQVTPPEDILPVLSLSSLRFEDLPPGFESTGSSLYSLEDQASFGNDVDDFRSQLESWKYFYGFGEFFERDAAEGTYEISPEVWLMETEGGAVEAFADGALVFDFPEMSKVEGVPSFGDDSEIWRWKGPYGDADEEFASEGYIAIIRKGPFLGSVFTAAREGQASQDEAIALAEKLAARLPTEGAPPQ